MSISEIKNNVAKKEFNNGLYLFLNEILLGIATPNIVSGQFFFIIVSPLSDAA
ncbi:hypothetical protein KHA90_04425 [Flavobacterium psychroterrae]|uniref:Uncharacterized protein n=1 Tax=Flavobacterium psychroterrae TaxID=2133767 RepID=A0ABS5P7N8_9FLAO|nr:hypothetical protein [Flavobacterium psychroterrae]MBS7230262.1 hypothetical protein [Flavobacterium psychroterrae]